MPGRKKCALKFVNTFFAPVCSPPGPPGYGYQSRFIEAPPGKQYLVAVRHYIPEQARSDIHVPGLLFLHLKF